MNFVAPWMLAAGAAAALGVVALHLLSTRRPPVAPLPTARFVPESDVRAVARRTTPTDLLLLALRVLAVLLVGAGFAQPLPDAPGPRIRSVIALEWTTALVDPDAARRAARAALAAGDALVLFDSAARVVAAEELEQLARPTVRRASQSAMYVAARDAAAQVARGADSLRLVVMAAVTADAIDAATPALRAAWPGRVERVALAAVADTAPAPSPLVIPNDAEDPLAPALRMLPIARGAHPLRIQRADVAAADSAWLAANPAGVLLHWPRRFSDAVRADGLVLLDSDVATLVAPLARLAVPEGRVVARWRDGAPAITERPMAAGCLRSVGVGLPERGDLTLRAPFSDFLLGVVAPCGGRRGPVLADSLLGAPADSGALADARALLDAGQQRSALAPWLLAAALLLLVAEQWLRRRAGAEAD